MSIGGSHIEPITQPNSVKNIEMDRKRMYDKLKFYIDHGLETEVQYKDAGVSAISKIEIDHTPGRLSVDAKRELFEANVGIRTTKARVDAKNEDLMLIYEGSKSKDKSEREGEEQLVLPRMKTQFMKKRNSRINRSQSVISNTRTATRGMESPSLTRERYL